MFNQSGFGRLSALIKQSGGIWYRTGMMFTGPLIFLVVGCSDTQFLKEERESEIFSKIVEKKKRVLKHPLRHSGNLPLFFRQRI